MYPPVCKQNRDFLISADGGACDAGKESWVLLMAFFMHRGGKVFSASRECEEREKEECIPFDANNVLTLHIFWPDMKESAVIFTDTAGWSLRK